MKLVECAVILLFFTAAGMYASSQLGKRRRQLRSLEKAILSLYREVDYHLSPLADAFMQTAGRAEPPWDNFFRQMGENIKMQQTLNTTMEEILGDSIRTSAKFHPWDSDLEILRTMGKGLGELDKKMQLARLDLAIEEIRQAEQEAGEEQKQKGKLYQTLGVCMGILGVILII